MEVEWTDMALAQLGDTMEYVSENFGVMTAQKAYDRIDKQVQSLVRYPESGRYDGVKMAMKFPLRHLTVAPNMIYYFVDTELDKIVILAVVHSRQSSRTINAILRRSLEQYKKD